jgi:hypothetical protein
VNLPTVVSLLSDAFIFMKNAHLEELIETCVLYFSVLDIITLIFFFSSGSRWFVVEGLTEQLVS